MAPEEIGARVFKVLQAQIKQRVKAGLMHPIAPEQFAINLLSLCVFPFAARPPGRCSASTRPASTSSSIGAARSWRRFF